MPADLLDLVSDFFPDLFIGIFKNFVNPISKIRLFVYERIEVFFVQLMVLGKKPVDKTEALTVFIEVVRLSK